MFLLNWKELFFLLYVSHGKSGLCRNSEHKEGTWIKDQTILFKNYICCGYDRNDFRSNIAICGGTNLQGLTNFYGSNDHRSQVGGNACTCDAKEGRNTVNTREKFLWVPSNCLLLPWNATQFCELLGNRIIYMEGDSTMAQSADALMSMLYTNKGGCVNQTFFTRPKNQGQGNALVQRLNKTRPDIAIFNFGAHGHDDGDLFFWWEGFIQTLKSKEMLMLRELKNINFLWRSNQPGHVNCTGERYPNSYGIDNYPQFNRSIDWYNWSAHKKWDNSSADNAEKNGMKLIDMSPLYYRSDAHPNNGDCLHYCAPGPVDLFPVILLQMLNNKEI
jgi:hypothetical protein